MIVFSARSVAPQSSNASVTGRITDSTKAVTPDAKVIAINTGTRVRFETVTNETGSYYVTNLPPGTYRIEVEKLGFTAVLKSDVILHVQDALEINFEMVLGSASESVTVRGGAPLLDTESSTMGTVVEQRKAVELPLNGRNVFNLIELAASVVPQGSSTGTPVGVNPFGWGNYQVDGSFGNDGRLDAIISTLGGPPVLLLNRCDNNNHWLSITLRGLRSNRDGYGAKVSVNGQTRFATSAGSYACASDKRLHFGLGSAENASVEVLWPSGTKQVLTDVRVDQFLDIREPEHS
jgi:hypothetical protein